MRPLFAAIVLTGAGCSGFSAPTPEILSQLKLNPPGHPDTTRYRIRMSVDSRWLAGEFDGIVLTHEGRTPLARAQLFGDLGPKMIDLLARPDRVAGYFPATREGIDCSLPAEAAPHPLFFLGVSLLEDFADISEDRVIGVRPEGGGWWLNLRPVVPGMRIEARQGQDGRTIERRFRWTCGLGWEERWESPDVCTITAPGMRIRVLVLESDRLESSPPRAYELSLPGDVRVAQGRRK